MDTQTDKQARDRDAAIKWARTLLTHGEFVIFDTETTGLASKDEVIEFSILASDGKKLMAHQRVRPSPTAVMNEQAFAIHGISMDDLQTAPPVSELANAIIAAIKGKTIIGWNVTFDVRLLLQTLLAAGIDASSEINHLINLANFEDAMLAHAGYVGEWDARQGRYRWQKLPGANHDSLTDCRAVLAVLHGMATTPTSDEVASATTGPQSTDEAAAVRTIAFEHGQGEITQGPGPDAVALLADLLSLISIHLEPDVIRSWTLAQCDEVKEWAGREYLAASDNTIAVMVRPSVIPQDKGITLASQDDGLNPAANGYSFSMFEDRGIDFDKAKFDAYLDTLLHLLHEAKAVSIALDDLKNWSPAQRAEAVTWAAKTIVAGIDLLLNGQGAFPSWPSFFPAHDPNATF